MAAPTVGTVVLIPFPFSDLSDSKLRPAVVLADAGRGDLVLCQITSKAYADDRAVQINDASFLKGSLRIISYARPGKLFTANKNLVRRSVGELSHPAFDEIIDAVVRLLKGG